MRASDAAYATARRLYNTRYDTLKPSAIAYVKHPADIAECLAFARRYDTPVAIRSGGHSYAGWSSGNGKLIVDVSALSKVGAPSGGITRIGAGAKLIDVYEGLGAHGVTIPGGSCPTVGISGLTLGGGHGVVSRAYGLTCDSLVGATLVTADGKTVDCDKSRHPDLFWALRGAGNGNFGVVTELRFRTHPAPRAVMAYMTWPWAKAAKVVASWQKWGPVQADEIWSACHLDARPGNTPSVSIAAFSLGEPRRPSERHRQARRPGGRPRPRDQRPPHADRLPGCDGVLRGLLLQVHRAVPYAGFAARPDRRRKAGPRDLRRPLALLRPLAVHGRHPHPDGPDRGGRPQGRQRERGADGAGRRDQPRRAARTPPSSTAARSSSPST